MKVRKVPTKRFHNIGPSTRPILFAKTFLDTCLSKQEEGEEDICNIWLYDRYLI